MRCSDAAVHLRVGPDRGDQLGDAPGRLLHLRRAAWSPTNVLATHSRPGSSAVPASTLRRPLAPGEVDAGGGQRRGDRSSRARRRGGQPGRQRLLAVGQRPAGPSDRRPRLDLAAQRVERGELRGRDLALGEPAERRRAASGRRSSSASTARVAAAAGLLISCASPAASVPERDQRLALPRGRLDACARCGRAPRSRCPPNGNQASDSSRSASAGTRSTRPGDRPAAGREVDAVLVPGPEPAGPATRARPSARRRCPRGRRGGPGRWRRRPAPTRSRRARPRGTGRRRARSRTSVAGLDQLGELVVGQAVEEAERAEVVDAHQIVAR